MFDRAKNDEIGGVSAGGVEAMNDPTSSARLPRSAPIQIGGDAEGERGQVLLVHQKLAASLADQSGTAGSDGATVLVTSKYGLPRRSKSARRKVSEAPEGQFRIDIHSDRALGGESKRDGRGAEAACAGHPPRDPQHLRVRASNNPGSAGAEGVHANSDVQIICASLSNTIAEIRVLWRQRQAWHRAEKSLTLQAKALCRGLAIEGDKKEADVIYQAAFGKGEHDLASAAYAAIFPLTDARAVVEKNRIAIEKRLAALAKSLPCATFVEATRGVGIASFAAIVGEAGDLSLYSNPGKLWKRMGLAPYQGRAPATHKSMGSASSGDWIAMGYADHRRSVMWNVGACIIKAGGPLRSLYDERKMLETAKCEAIAADPELRKSFSRGGKYAPKLHAHLRAQRYVEKRFLRDLWRAWRDASELTESTPNG